METIIFTAMALSQKGRFIVKLKNNKMG